MGLKIDANFSQQKSKFNFSTQTMTRWNLPTFLLRNYFLCWPAELSSLFSLQYIFNGSYLLQVVTSRLDNLWVCFWFILLSNSSFLSRISCALIFCLCCWVDATILRSSVINPRLTKCSLSLWLLRYKWRQCASCRLHQTTKIISK